jgi:polyhydroxyalkanoate synthesis repressor PhaR
MRLIKKYANRKLYDTKAKRYIARHRVAELIKKGEALKIIDHTSGEDITASVVAQLLGENNSRAKDGVPTGILIQLLRKGGDTLTDYAKKYTYIWQSAMTMAEDEIDRFVNRLVKNREISLSEAGKLKKDLSDYGDHLKKWIGDKIDHRLNEILDRMNLATKDQVKLLADQLKTLNRKIAGLEKVISDKKSGKRRDA